MLKVDIAEKRQMQVVVDFKHLGSFIASLICPDMHCSHLSDPDLLRHSLPYFSSVFLDCISLILHHWFAETFIAVFLICISRLSFSDPSPPAPFCKTFIGDTTEVALWPTLAHFITELLLLRDVESLFIEPVYFYPPSHLLPHRWIVKYFVQSPENRSRRKMFLILRFKLWPQLSFFPSGALLPRWGIHKKWTQSNNESFWKKWFFKERLRNFCFFGWYSPSPSKLGRGIATARDQ